MGILPQTHPVPDMQGREAWSVVPLLILCLAIGVYPKPLIDTVKPDLEALAGMYNNLHVESVARASVGSLEARR